MRSRERESRLREARAVISKEGATALVTSLARLTRSNEADRDFRVRLRPNRWLFVRGSPGGPGRRAPAHEARGSLRPLLKLL
jgi:hypothetical protein